MRRRLTNDIRLRNVVDADLPIFFDHQLDLDANRMAGFTARDRDAFMAHWARILGDKTVAARTILFNGQVAGNIVSFEQSGRTEVGYWLGKEFWGKGIATRALDAFLDDVTVRPVFAHVAKHNAASIRVLVKCGFTVCGEDTVVIDGTGKEIEEFILELGASGDE